MTVTSTAPEVSDTTQTLRSALDRLRREAVDYAAAKLDSWRRQVKGLEESAGATDRAVVGGLIALASGRNPIRGALAAAWSGADGWKKAQIVGVVLLLGLLAPIVLLLLLLALLVTAVVRPGTQGMRRAGSVAS